VVFEVFAMGSVQSCSSAGKNNHAFNTFGETQSRSALEQIIGIRNLPAEVLQKIALKLPREGYAALRQTCKWARQPLLSVKAMNECINQGLSGEREEPYKKIVNTAKNEYISKVARGAILGALKTIKVGRFYDAGNDHDGDIALLCRYPSQRDKEREVLKVLDSFCELIRGKASIKHFRVLYKPQHSVIFLASHELASIEKLFFSANKVFKECKGGEKLVLASLVTALKLHLCRNLTEADIDNLAAHYPDMFSMGEIIHKKYAPEVNDVSPTDIQSPFRAME
jgi:hypothetical protein